MALRLIRLGCGAVFVGGIVGMIVSSINGNNNAVVLSMGGAIALAAVVLFAVTAVSGGPRLEVFEEADAERLEAHVAELVAGGADEAAVRALVRDALRIRRARS